MNKFLLLFILLGAHNITKAQVLISDVKKDDQEIHPSAILELKSNNKGFLPPKLSKSERQKIQNPAKGLMIYLVEKDIQCLQVFDGTGWADIYCPTLNHPPIVENINIKGYPSIGETITANYKYIDKEDDKELSCEINWYVANNENSTKYIPLNNKSKNYLIQEKDEGKFILFSVKPKAISGNQKVKEYFSDPIGPIISKDNSVGISESDIIGINEFHYNNVGNDSNEFVEIKANKNISDLENYKIIHYNDKDGKIIKETNLSSTIKTQDGAHTYFVWKTTLQNGPDALALIDANSKVINFISYQGKVTATEGEVKGLTSKDIGIKENNSTPLNSSIYLSDEGFWKISLGKNTKGGANE